MQARHEGAVCAPNGSREWGVGSRQKPEPQAQTCALRLIVPSLSVGFARLPGFPLVRLSEHGLRRNYIVSRDSISSEQAVSFTPGPAPPPPSSSSLFSVVPAFPPSLGDKGPLCVPLPSPATPCPPTSPRHTPEVPDQQPAETGSGLAWHGPDNGRNRRCLR